MREETKIYLTDLQLAERYGISRNSVWRLSRTGELPAPVNLFKATTRWRLSEIEAFEAERAAEPRQPGNGIGKTRAMRANIASVKAKAARDGNDF